MPRFTVFSIGAQSMALVDILPTSHAVIALQKIFVLGAGLSAVVYELNSLTVRSGLDFAMEAWRFKWTLLRAAR